MSLLCRKFFIVLSLLPGKVHSWAIRPPWSNLTLLINRRRQWHPTPILLPGKSHGWRSLVGCRPWGRWGLDMTEQLHFHFSLSCIGEGNGNPLQCSCLENPRDGGALWAAVYGVTQSRTRLKWLSSSSSKSYPGVKLIRWRVALTCFGHCSVLFCVKYFLIDIFMYEA